MDANIKTPQDALEWLDRSIREEAELDGEMSNEHAIQLAFIQSMLAKFPRRNCDVGTAEEQAKRWYWRYHVGHLCQSCPLGPIKWSEVDRGTLCFSKWAQMPYEEGGAK